MCVKQKFIISEMKTPKFLNWKKKRAARGEQLIVQHFSSRTSYNNTGAASTSNEKSHNLVI